MLLSFDRLPDRHGVDIVDHVERRQCTVETPTPISPSETTVDDFQFPVDRGVKFETESITLPHRVAVLVRNSMGYQVQKFTKGQSETLPRDQYTLDLTASVKLYLIVDAPLSIDATPDEVKINFGEKAEVKLGARSYHKNPAGTITTTNDPEDVMQAVSMLSSSLKTTSVERSYPTLRGHPPTIELGDELKIPDELDRPETGVSIEVPPTLRSVLVVAPLAFYLGAKVVSGPVPTLTTESGFEHQLSDPERGFEGEVERVLKQTFFLDCLTRTEGYYPVNLHERSQLEDSLGLDFAGLYDQSIPKQLEAYLEIPYDVIKGEVPQWKLTARMSMIPENIEMLPFVLNDLAVVKSSEAEAVGQQEVMASNVDDFVRSGDFLRSSSEGQEVQTASTSPTSLVQPDRTDSLEQAWVGDGIPVGATKAMIEAYQNRLNRTPADGDIDITVICNDTAMNNERDIVDDIYGSREELPFDIHSHHALQVDELRTVLEQDWDFLHYIGHIDRRGFECVDGFLDASTLESTGVDSFLLNACTSYKQGMELIRAGSVTGVVTVEDVINSGAERIGSSLAKLLNFGFPFNAALEIAKNQSIVGGQYLVLGDGGVDIAQSQGSVPALCELESGESYELSYYTFPTFDMGLGSITIPHAGGNNEFYIASGDTGNFVLSIDELKDFLSIETQPIQHNGKLYWTDEIEPTDLIDT